MSHVIVRTSRPGRRRLWMAGLLLALSLAGWGLYEYAHYRGRLDGWTSWQQEVVTGEDAALQQELLRLRQENAVLKQGTQIDDLSCRSMESNIFELQTELGSCKDDLAFYRTIISSGEDKKGLRVAAFDITQSADSGYYFKLVLAQVLGHPEDTEGTAHFVVEGMQAGKAVTLEQQEIVVDGMQSFRFKFRYFQNIEGIMILPGDFVPVRVVVRLEPEKNAGKLEKIFEWPNGEA